MLVYLILLINNWTQKNAITNVIEESWVNVKKYIPPTTLSLCESDLKGITSLLVLATIKRAADTNLENRENIEIMFQAADTNGDGQLTYKEWVEWLGATPDEHQKGMDTSAPFASTTMVNDLKYVLSFAVSAVNLASRLNSDASFLVAAFTAGGVSSGFVDAMFYEAMIKALSAETR